MTSRQYPVTHSTVMNLPGRPRTLPSWNISTHLASEQDPTLPRTTLFLTNTVPESPTYTSSTVNTLRSMSKEQQASSLQNYGASNMTDYMLNHHDIIVTRPGLSMQGHGAAPGREDSAEYEGTLKIHDRFKLGTTLPPVTRARLITEDALKDVSSLGFTVTPDPLMAFHLLSLGTEEPREDDESRVLEVSGSTMNIDGYAKFKMEHAMTQVDLREDASGGQDENAVRKAVEGAWQEEREIGVRSYFLASIKEKKDDTTAQ
ncbi:hypothetical protein IAT38_001783 [Cryptococcus sp. DSM 104549]